MKKTYWLQTESGELIRSKALTRQQAENSKRKILMNFGQRVEVIEK